MGSAGVSSLKQFTVRYDFNVGTTTRYIDSISNFYVTQVMISAGTAITNNIVITYDVVDQAGNVVYDLFNWNMGTSTLATNKKDNLLIQPPIFINMNGGQNRLRIRGTGAAAGEVVQVSTFAFYSS